MKHAWLFAAALALSACSGSSGTDGGSDAGSPPDSGSGGNDGGLTDAQVCAQACAQSTTCGASHTSTCASGCQTDAQLILCFRQAVSCNDNAMCWWAAEAQALCDAGTGLPSGASTCNQVQSCEAACNAVSAGHSCHCGCRQQLNPAKAELLLNNDSCGDVVCAGSCTPIAGPGCNTCTANSCSTQANACTSN